MIKRDELISFVNQTIGKELFEKAAVKDEFGANGVQISGGENVEKVALGVSLNEEFLQKAVFWGANFCIFHHSFDVRTYKSLFSISSQKRLKLIFKNDLTILGFHYALDAHPEIGNNAMIIKKLGGKIVDSLFEEWGFVGRLQNEISIHDLAHKCEKIFNHDVFVVEGDKAKVKTIGVVSGAGKPYGENIAEMEGKGVELYISGETSESTPHRMKESGISYFVCGHYATEVFGIQELGKRIKDNFGEKVEVNFIDVENPI